MSRAWLPSLNAMLNNSIKGKDTKGNEVVLSIFPEEDLLEFLKLADSSTKTVLGLKNVDDHVDLIVEYAFYLALISKSLIEKGREYAIEDKGVYINPPNVADHLMNIAQMALDNWHRKVNIIVHKDTY